MPQVDVISAGRRFEDREATDRILSKARDRREDGEAAFIRAMISAHEGGAHVPWAAGPNPDCPLCACSS